MKSCATCIYEISTCFDRIGVCDQFDKWEGKISDTTVYGRGEIPDEPVRDYNIGASDYSKRKIQPWDIWLEYGLNPWDADIIKRVLRIKEDQVLTKDQARRLEYQKIKHICDERIRQLEEKEE